MTIFNKFQPRLVANALEKMILSKSDIEYCFNFQVAIKQRHANKKHNMTIVEDTKAIKNDH